MSGVPRVAEGPATAGPVRPEAALLDALDGVAYLTSLSGVILEIGVSGWEAAASAAAGRLTLPVSDVLGRSVFDFIQGEDVAGVCRRIQTHVASGGRHLAYEYRCDAPDLRRQMRLSVSAVRAPPGDVRLLYQSQVLSAVERPWMSLFEPERIVAARGAESALPIVGVCAFCHDVRWGEAAAPWAPPERYYAEGGRADVRVSHGVCPRCRDSFDDLLQDAT